MKQRRSINYGAVLTNVVSVVILSIIGLVGTQVYQGATDGLSTLSNSVDVLIEEVSTLRSQVDSMATSPAPAGPRTVPGRVLDAVTLSPLWKGDGAETDKSVDAGQARRPGEVEFELRRRIDEKTRREGK